MQPQPDDRVGGEDLETWSRSMGEAPAREGSSINDGTLDADRTPSEITPDLAADSRESGESGERTPTPSGERSDEWDRRPPPVIAKGEEVFGKYRLLEKIGEGGMGEVWLVDNLELDRQSALKLIKPGIAQNDKGWGRFRREARLMAKLEHPNAVAVYDFKRTQSMGYIEMEFVRGRSLDKYLKEQGGKPLPLEWIAGILDQLCSVLQDAHGHLDEKSGKPKPIIHRDLKPSNLMLVDRKPAGKNLKVLDFGIAKMIEEDGGQEATLTGAGDLLGTPAFMSPEQIRGGWGRDAENDIDGRSDLYSVGVMLYQFLTGKPPFRRRDPRALMAAHLSENPPPLKETEPALNIPPAVERLVMHCLEKDPTKRPQSAMELAQKFREAAGLAEKPRRVFWMAIAVAVLGMGLAGSLPLAFLSNREARLSSAGHAESAKEDRTKPAAEPPKPWEPAGYQAVDGRQLAEGTDEPLRLEKDGVDFYRVRPGIYLPAGYKPESENWTAEEGRWPPVILRESDGARFIRIEGGTFEQGDPAPEPANDSRLKPLTAHWVRVGGYYIQETEVTNAEIEKYLALHSEDAGLFAMWKQRYAKHQKIAHPVEKAQRFPAECVSYAGARKYARQMGGRLPSEAEWEFSGKSRDGNRAYPWGMDRPAQRGVPWANIFSAFSGSLASSVAEVKSFPKDKTEQGVYDMVGNVSEWCLDPYRPYAEIIPADNTKDHPIDDPGAKPDPAGTAPLRVARGGSVRSSELKAKAFFRQVFAEDEPGPEFVGFRIVVECPPERDLAQTD